MSRRVPQVLSMLLSTLALTVPSFAQQTENTTWRVDSDHSVSRFSLGTIDSNSIVAVAEVRGTLHLDSTANGSTVAFEITLAGTDSADAYPNFAFRSHDVRFTPSGKLIAAGELSVTSVDRAVTFDANEGYSGPVDSDVAFTTTITRPVTFVFDAPAASLAAEKDPQVVAARSVLTTEDFPGVRDLVIESNWPLVAIDQNCEPTSDANEGYQAPECTGTAVSAPKSHEVPSTVSAEDDPTLDTVLAPGGNKILIALDLHLDRVERSSEAPRERTAD